ncbi:UDP-N-acetylmuramate--L-alanine ligase [Desulforegula conservatrix]|uniref:UDP-N-acetylmuramate--L-alanine ligase n=1 Tax=Desulforegula conservatrix TaxID=153026 RepID=UPI000413BAFD|nr:UDP-N-acetylmuramate--L-alanine ligase [Desulforegula conservatrix]
MYQKKYHIHFVGIGGIGMSGIAELLINLGYTVSGSDIKKTDITDRLSEIGGNIFECHEPENIDGADVVVISSAVSPANPEVAAAREAGIPVIPRAEMLAELMRLKYSIAVAGAHGKTTTTSMIAAILGKAELDPTVVIGGKLKSIGLNALLGKGDYLVAEADESDGSFLKMSPAIAVVTNIDREHLDHYGNMENIKDAFSKFINSVPFYGTSVVCLDNEALQDILPKIKKRHITYGLSSQADLQARAIKLEGFRSTYSVFHHSKKLGDITLNLPGIHNVYNSLAAIAVSMELGVNFEHIRDAFATIQGVQRRLELKGEAKGAKIFDDYGHHPTEIKTTLAALREIYPENKIIVVFQPHRYSRTRDLFDEFIKSFYQSDSLVLLPIYAAGEQEIPELSHNSLGEAISAHGHREVLAFDSLEEAADHVFSSIKSGDVVLTLGAGNVWRLGERIISMSGDN